MKIVLNGDEMETECGTLHELLEFLEHKSESVATAVNKEFVPLSERMSVKLESGDLIEIIAPMSGG